MRPRVAPALVAELTEAAPARLLRKLDEDPRQAEAWTWEQAQDELLVRSPRGEVVRLLPREGALRAPEQVVCSCLLSPRCLHALAALALLELEDAPAAGPAAVDPPPPALEPADEEGLELSAGQREVAARAWRSGGELLAAGGAAAGAVQQAELLRVVHGARLAGLHRLGAAGTRLVSALRDLRGGRPEGALEALADEAAEWLEAAALLEAPGRPSAAGLLAAGPSAAGAAAPRAAAGPRGRALASAVGQARRSYAPEGSLRLWGLCAEPVVSRAGYAGVTTLLADEQGRCFSLANVRPGPAERALAAYEQGVEVGDATLSHRELARAGLILQGATASPEGRLGAGRGVRAVRAAGAPWSERLAARLGTPLAAQARAAAAALDAPPDRRRAGDDLLAGEGVVLGACSAALWLQVEGSPLRALPPATHPALPALENLRLLARAPGLELVWLGRCDPLRARTITLLAIAAKPAAERALVLPEAWGGRCNLGLDALNGAHLPGLERTPERFELDPGDDAAPLLPLRRRLERLALGGRTTLAGGAQRALLRDRALLEERALGGAAALLAALAQAAAGDLRAVDGTLAPPDLDALGRAFLAAARYERAARRALWLIGWS
ncbi:MAG: hypothetical protein AB7N76_18250 [Planctomycetota bacterium]